MRLSSETRIVAAGDRALSNIGEVLLSKLANQGTTRGLGYKRRTSPWRQQHALPRLVHRPMLDEQQSIGWRQLPEIRLSAQSQASAERSSYELGTSENPR
jgi:hypothetical protein